MIDNDNSNVDLEDEDGSLQIAVNTLDNELAKVGTVDLLKIDVEGFELSVLKGADGIIRNYKPKLLIELHPLFIRKYGADCNSVIDFLEHREYKIAYYSFLNNHRFSRVGRFMARYVKRGHRFTDKHTFLQDIQIKPALSSYHLYCEPQ